MRFRGGGLRRLHQGESRSWRDDAVDGAMQCALKVFADSDSPNVFSQDPVYYDLYVGDGLRRRFMVTNVTGALGELVSITTPRGVTLTPGDMGIHIVYDSNGVRQFLTPSRLADVTPFPKFKGYEVKVYALQDKPLKDPATGLYVPPQTTPVKHLKIVPENGWRRAIVTLKSGDNDPKRYVFNYAFNDWSLNWNCAFIYTI